MALHGAWLHVSRRSTHRQTFLNRLNHAPVQIDTSDPGHPNLPAIH